MHSAVVPCYSHSCPVARWTWHWSILQSNRLSLLWFFYFDKPVFTNVFEKNEENPFFFFFSQALIKSNLSLIWFAIIHQVLVTDRCVSSYQGGWPFPLCVWWISWFKSPPRRNWQIGSVSGTSVFSPNSLSKSGSLLLVTFHFYPKSTIWWE